MNQAYALFGILAVMIILFIWDYWRFDIVSFLGLITAVLLGIVPYDQAFSADSVTQPSLLLAAS